MVNYLRTNYRISGNQIDSSSLAVAAGSNTTAGRANPIGDLQVAHGLATTPAFAWGAPICANTLATVGRAVRIMGRTATDLTFITTSALIANSAVQTLVTSTLSSGVTMTFVWAAFG